MVSRRRARITDGVFLSKYVWHIVVGDDSTIWKAKLLVSKFEEGCEGVEG